MIRTIMKGAIAGLGLILAASSLAQARTDAETKAIVLKFNNDAFAKGDKSALPGEMTDDFIEHHATAANATPERTRAQFLARFGSPSFRFVVPPPDQVLVSGDYVIFVTKRQAKDPTATGKTYEQDVFDLFKVSAGGKVSEHWDSGTINPGGKPPA